MKDHGIERVCCLLDDDQLGFYEDLLGDYRQAFGDGHVCHAPVKDYNLCNADTLHNDILPFLRMADQDGARVVVHCSGGSGRTGHILAAWSRARVQPGRCDLRREETGANRSPREAIAFGATEDQLQQFLRVDHA